MVDITRSVVITGASTGIGEACALRLDKAGWRVFAGVRKEADADRLKGEASDRLTPLMLDVTDQGQISSAQEIVAAAIGEGGLAGLVNNAGAAGFCRLDGGIKIGSCLDVLNRI